jgi:hypothetical protein
LENKFDLIGTVAGIESADNFSAIWPGSPYLLSHYSAYFKLRLETLSYSKIYPPIAELKNSTAAAVEPNSKLTKTRHKTWRKQLDPTIIL